MIKGMRFGIDKCGVLAMHRGKESECEGIINGSGELTGEIDDEGYKYLGIMERSNIFHQQMKDGENEYFKIVRSALKSKLNAGNVFQAINSWAVPTVQYGAGIIQWTKELLQQMDRFTRKLITIYGGLHPRSCVDRLYIPRSDRGSGLVNVENHVKEEKCNLAKYAAQSKEALVKTATAELNLEKCIVNVRKKEKKENRLKEWKQKALHGQFVREAECHNESKKWKRLRNRELKKETERLFCAAQEQAIRTNSVKYSIVKISEISTCPNLAKNQY